MKITLAGETVSYGTGTGSSGDADRGPGDRESVVFVHGAGFAHGVWVMPARYFARHGFNVVAPDLPAHGGSAGAALTSIEAMADWLAELVHATCTGAVTIVGHSMGSLVALALSQRHPQLVQRRALLGTSNPMPVGPPLLQAAADNHHAAIEMANTWSHSHAAGLGASENPGTSNFYSGQRWLERMADGVYYADLNACNDYQPNMETLDNLPTLIITGSKDKMTPARAGQQLAERLAGAQELQLSGSGHAMLSEQPDAVLDALAGFIL